MLSNIDRIYAEIEAQHRVLMDMLNKMGREVAVMQVYCDILAEATGRATGDSQVLPYQDAANVESDRPASSHGAR